MPTVFIIGAMCEKFSRSLNYRSRGFNDDPKRGLRIDHILCTEDIKNFLYIDARSISYELRAMEKPSDHAPIWASFKF